MPNNKYFRDWRKNNPDKVKLIQKKYHQSIKGKIACKKANDKRRIHDSYKRKARSFIEYLIFKKYLAKESCAICGNKNVHAHHENYNLPNVIIWLCVSCHGKIHRKYIGG